MTDYRNSAGYLVDPLQEDAARNSAGNIIEPIQTEGGGGGGGSTIAVENDGTLVDAAATTLNFVNAAGVTSASGVAVIELVNSVEGLVDVEISSPSNGQVLTYNSTADKWENENASGGSGGWTKMTFSGSAGTYLGYSNSYESDATITIAAGQTLEIESYEHNVSNGNCYVSLSADGTHGITWGQNGSGEILIANAGVAALWTTGGAAFTGLHKSQMSFNVESSSLLAVSGLIDNAASSTYSVSGLDLVGTANVYVVTDNIALCAVRYRIVTASVFS